MSETENFLSLADVLRKIGRDTNKDRAIINRYFLVDEEAPTLLGAVGTGRNIKYPLSEVWRFEDLFRQHDLGIISPKNGGEYLRKNRTAQPPIDAHFTTDTDGGIRINEYTGDSTTGKELGKELMLAPGLANQLEQGSGIFGNIVGPLVAKAIVDAVKESGLLPPPSDRFITREEAAALLGLQDKPQSLSRRVPPVSPGLWSHRMVQQYMADMVARAQEKQAARQEKRAKK